MLSYNCPRCGARFSLFDWRAHQSSSGRRFCRSCGAVLEIGNIVLISVPGGLIVGMLGIAVKRAPSGTSSLAFAVMALVALLLMLAILHFWARWIVTAETEPYGTIPPDPPVAQRWWKHANVTLVVAAIIVIVCVAVDEWAYRHSHGSYPTDPLAADPAASLLLQANALTPVGMLIAVVLGAYGAYAYSRRLRVLRAAQPDPAGGGGATGSLWRRSGALRWTVYLLLIFVVPQTCVWVALDTVNRRKVERKLQAIRDAGQPVTMTEAAPAPVPDDQNAAILYQQVFRVDFSDPLHGKDSLLKATGHSKLIESEFREDGSNAAQVRAVLNAPGVISIFETLEQASFRPHSIFAIHWEDGTSTLFPHLARLRQAARWLSAKARLCTLDGDPDEALRWLAVLFRMSDHAAQEPTTIGQLVAAAIQSIGLWELERTLSETTPSAEATQIFLDCLQRLDVKQRFNEALPGRRAMGLHMYAELRHPRPESDWAAEFGRSPVETLFYWYRFTLFRPLYNADLGKYLTRVEENLARSALVPAPPPPPPAPRRRGPFDLDLELMQAVDVFDYTSRLLEKRDTAIMNIDIAQVALALTLYKIEHGEYPATLEELQATLDWELPQDFFAGAPLTYQRRPDGFLLYSFGIDRDDDGGASPRAPGQSWKDYDAVWECPLPLPTTP